MQLPDGRLFDVAVPEGLAPGDEFCGWAVSDGMRIFLEEELLPLGAPRAGAR